jgi:hypothetical protein
MTSVTHAGVAQTIVPAAKTVACKFTTDTRFTAHPEIQENNMKLSELEDV